MNFDLVINKPKDITEILETHTHGPDMARLNMLQGCNNMKERAMQDIDQITRSIYACGVETMNEPSLVQMLISSRERYGFIKMVIKNKLTQHLFPRSKYLKLLQKVNPFYVTIQDLRYQLNHYICHWTLSILQDSYNWLANGTFKISPQQFYQLYIIHAKKDG